MSALLVLEDERTFPGEAYGAVGTALGEVVFTTGMTGYQETLTDPSFARQIVVQTAPHIGNTGVNDEDDESAAVQVAGYVVRDPARVPSSWRSRRRLEDELAGYGVVGLSGIDTRALVRHLAARGALRGGVFSGLAATRPVPELVGQVRASASMLCADLVGAVTTTAPYLVPAVGRRRFTVAAVDLGIKASSPAEMARRGMDVHVLPATVAIEELFAVGGSGGPDGIFFSNGPGDPATADHPVALASAALARGVPVFGICFGNQILGRALGLGTYKLPYGHRGMNIPVRERATGRVSITAQNHGFAVAAPGGGVDRIADSPFGRIEVSHVCLNDGSVEGLRALNVPAFSVQYHPEAAAGPHDANPLFDRFAELMATNATDPPTAPTKGER